MCDSINLFSKLHKAQLHNAQLQKAQFHEAQYHNALPNKARLQGYLKFNKGYSLVEVLVITGIISLVIVTMIYQYNSSANTNKKISSSQLLEQRQTLLLERLKRDIRSAKKMEKTANTYIFHIMADNKTSDTELEKVEWSIEDNGKSIVRNGEMRKKYDFKEFISNNKKVILNIR